MQVSEAEAHFSFGKCFVDTNITLIVAMITMIKTIVVIAVAGD